MDPSFHHSAGKPVVTSLLALALLVSGCTEVEGPLPLRPDGSRAASEARVSRLDGEVRAPKGNKILTLKASSNLGVPVESVPEEEGFTRAVIEPDSEGAAVLWEAGDSIKVQFLKDEVLYYAVLRTEEGGSSEAVFTTDDDILGGTEYTWFSPGYERKHDNSPYTRHRVFGLSLPQSQTAVADGISSGMSLAFASTDSFEDGMSVSFTNLPALLRFRLSGGIAGSVKSVTLKTTSGIAGMEVWYNASGYPSYDQGYFSNTVWFTSVTLNGDFEAGKEYHIALWPRELNGFEMEFSDGEGNFTTLRTQEKITLGRSVVTDIGTINLGDSFRGLGSISTAPVKYMSATEGTKPVSVAIIPDGFTLGELPLYESLAKMAYDFLFDTEPYKTYKNRFNAWILKVASNESGAGITDGNYNVITPVDNYFSSQWGESSYSDMKSDDKKVFNFVSSNCEDITKGIHPIDEVPVIIIVNDNRYGGVAWTWPAGSGYCIIPWAYSGRMTGWSYPSIVPLSESDPKGGYRDRTSEEKWLYGKSNGDWRNTVVHEFGHIFGRLADEYWKSPPSTASVSTINSRHNYAVPSGLNISASYSTTPWDEFIQRRDELMGIDERYSRIGKYQGGGTHIFGAWRSERVSGMMDNRQYFNAWSRYLIAQRIMKLSGDESQFNFDYWLSHDVTADPLRDSEGDNASTRSGDPDRSGRYYYIFPHDPEEYLPPDAPVQYVDDEPAPPGI